MTELITISIPILMMKVVVCNAITVPERKENGGKQTEITESVATESPIVTVTEDSIKYPVVLKYPITTNTPVYISGSFTNWEQVPLTKTGESQWIYTTELPAGKHAYKFKVEDKEESTVDYESPMESLEEKGLCNIVHVEKN